MNPRHTEPSRLIAECMLEISNALANISKRIDLMSIQLDALTAQVAASVTIEQSAITLIQGLAAQINEAKDDPAALAALSDNLKASADALSAAVAANTQAQPTA